MFWSQDATNGCCYNNDCNAHTEERMGNVVNAMKLLGLEGRVHLERISVREGHKFHETVAQVCRAG